MNKEEKQKLHLVERQKHMIEKISYENYAIFHDNLNDLWYFCFLDKSGFPKYAYDGSKVSVNKIYCNYVLNGFIDWSILEKDDSI